MQIYNTQSLTAQFLCILITLKKKTTKQNSGPVILTYNANCSLIFCGGGDCEPRSCPSDPYLSFRAEDGRSVFVSSADLRQCLQIVYKPCKRKSTEMVL